MFMRTQKTFSYDATPGTCVYPAVHGLAAAWEAKILVLSVRKDCLLLRMS